MTLGSLVGQRQEVPNLVPTEARHPGGAENPERVAHHRFVLHAEERLPRHELRLLDVPDNGCYNM
jgi:hypothetical protein